MQWISGARRPVSAPFAAPPNARPHASKRPALRSRQGMWTLYGEAGQVLKRGHELAGVLFPLERRLLKLVED
jgi:hypothetical protein